MEATEITFEVLGRPIPQPRARTTRRGHTYTPDNGILAYKAAITMAARFAAGPGGPHPDPFEFEVEFVIERPASHRRTSGALAASAPRHPPKRAGDWDNLAKGVCDAITMSEAVWKDDDQVVDARVRRRYAVGNEMANTIIVLRRVPP